MQAEVWKLQVEEDSRLRVATVVLLLVVSAVLLTISVATLSFAVWLAGAVALLASFVVDHRRPTRRGVRPRHPSKTHTD
jgi:hypothetical protein